MILDYLTAFFSWLCSVFAILPTRSRLDPVDDDDGQGKANAQLASTYNFTDKTLNGRRAEALLSDAFLNACIENIVSRYRQEMEDAELRDIELLQVNHIRLRAIKDFRNELRRHLSSAKLFEVALQRRKLAEDTVTKHVI